MIEKSQILVNISECSIFILINTLGVLQFTGPKNDVFETKCGQTDQKSSYAILVLIWLTFPRKKWEGVLTRERAFIRMNTVVLILTF